jgi:hypothetical protein
MTEPDVHRVECYSGHTYAQEPRSVLWRGRRYAVVHVQARWRTPEGPAFRIETEQGMCFELYYHEIEARWTIWPVAESDSAPAPADLESP